MAEDLQRLFARVRDVDWNPKKREDNLRDHKIDFEDVKGIFDGPIFVRRSDRHGETRYQVFGHVAGHEIALACALREGLCWFISARPASRSERRKYYSSLKGRFPPGQD